MKVVGVLGLVSLAALVVCAQVPQPIRKPPTVQVPLGLMPLQFPADNPYTPEKAELGRFLYFDVRTSADNTVSCASCHSPEHGYTDGASISPGIHGQKSGRSAPTVLNRAYSLAQFWDGRASTLEEQAKSSIQNPIEMGATHSDVVAKIGGIAGYRPLFQKAFGSPEVTVDKMAQAIATFERTLLSGNSPYDRYKAGDKKALTLAQIRGLDVFVNTAKCDQCHEGINFTTNSYANLGVGADKAEPDSGRFVVTHQNGDWGAFKTPTLRDVARTAPYMHDGSLKTLDDVVDFYDKGGIPNRNLDEKIRPLKLTDAQKKDLVEFLKSLSGEGWQKTTAPAVFPQ